MVSDHLTKERGNDMKSFVIQKTKKGDWSHSGRGSWVVLYRGETIAAFLYKADAVEFVETLTENEATKGEGEKDNG